MRAIAFIAAATLATAAYAMPGMTPADGKAPASNPHGSAPVAAKPVAKVAKATGPDAATVSEVVTGAATKKDKSVTIHGQVVKVTAGVLGKNWLHVQDGTGREGSKDLTVTTVATAKVGDTVLVKGNVATNKDFGFGYKYNVIIENAQVTVE